MKVSFILLFFVFMVYAREPFTNLEGAVGYIVVERKGKIENFIVVEGKDGSVRTIKVEKNPKEFLKKSEDEAPKK